MDKYYQDMLLLATQLIKLGCRKTAY